LHAILPYELREHTIIFVKVMQLLAVYGDDPEIIRRLLPLSDKLSTILDAYEMAAPKVQRMLQQGIFDLCCPYLMRDQAVKHQILSPQGISYQPSSPRTGVTLASERCQVPVSTCHSPSMKNVLDQVALFS